ncbi:hypothetical protein QFZ70_001504 [Arthrobacter sp. V1I9]|uniref:hypothetical protein n=1 Tax=Arthrobacter sp. V1I9 TaxID=3042275 RepID=UPI00278D4CD2|nr:hypothetical protein [Arthrobacter sp. V1I9]MDQ0869031.1 hypothetical protein [Arthrobacter sp. V1I9]
MELDAQLEQTLRQGRGVFFIMIFVGLAVILLNLPTFIGLGLPTILDDYRLLFLASFSSLAGIGLIAFAVYYRKSYTSAAFTNYEIGKKRIDGEMLGLSELLASARNDHSHFGRWMIQNRRNRDGEGGFPDDPER